MSPSSEVETIRCLLCRGVVCFSAEDDSRYKDHLNLEHRVYYFISWIIQKTVEENFKDEYEEVPALPSITITPISRSKSTHNGSRPALEHLPVITKVESNHQTVNMLEGEEEEEEMEEAPPIMSIFPVSQLTDLQPAVEPIMQAIKMEPGLDPLQNKEYLEEDGDMQLKEAKIITIRVEGQRVGGKKMYKCSLCPNVKPWPTVHKAERHRITHIPLAFRKMFQCPQCKERFIKEKNVKRHIDSGLCQGPKDHPCTVCGDVFESKFDLQLHEENHEQLLKRYRCHLCGAKFNKTKYLNKHIKSHSNRKPYKCDICGKSFKSEYYVKTHRNAHLNGPYAGGGSGLESNGNPEEEEEEMFEFEHLQPQVDLIEDDDEDECQIDPSSSENVETP